jgi:hypothetical protein
MPNAVPQIHPPGDCWKKHLRCKCQVVGFCSSSPFAWGVAGTFKEIGDMLGPLRIGLASQTFGLTVGFGS